MSESREPSVANSYKPPRKACAYVRMSSDDQKHSIEIQSQRIEEEGKREGFEIVHWYEDKGRSASRETKKRVAWLRLLNDAATAEWSHVLIYNHSRFSRLDSFEEALVVQRLREHGKILHSVAEGEDDWESSFGRLQHAYRAEENNKFSRELGYAVVDGKIKAFKDGRQRGYVSYGFIRRVVDPQGNVRDLKRSEKFRLPDDSWSQSLIHGDPDEIEVVRWIFHTYATQDVGRRALAKELNVRRVPSPAGRLWCAVGITHILRNEAYAGDVRFGKYKEGKFATTCGDQVVIPGRSKEPSTDRGLLRKGNHDGLVERQIWDLVQVKLDRNKGQGRRLPRGSGGFPLTGILYCGHCGRTLGGRRENRKKSAGVVTYVCRSGADFGAGCGCGVWRIKEADILPLIVSRLADEIDLRLLDAKSVRPPSTERPTAQERIVQLQQSLEKLDRRIADGVTRLLESPEKLRRAIEAKLGAWEDERQSLLQQIDQVGHEGPSLHETLVEYQRWFSAANSELVDVQRSPEHGSEFEDGVKLTTESFRESLQRYGCRVYVWWSRQPGCRYYNVDRARILLGCSPKGQGALPCPSDPVDGSTRCNDNLDTNGTGNGFPVPFVSGIIDLEVPGSEVQPRRFAELAAKVQELRAEGLTAEEVLAYVNTTGQQTGKGNVWTLQRMYGFFRTAKEWGQPAPSLSA